MLQLYRISPAHLMWRGGPSFKGHVDHQRDPGPASLLAKDVQQVEQSGLSPQHRR